MPNATGRANAQTLPEATSYPDANIRALAAQFETALQAYSAFFHGGGTDDEAAAATDAVKAVAQKIIAVPGTDISIMRLKARVYLWAESTDLEKLGACPSSGGIFGTNLIRLRHEQTFSSLDN